MRKTASEQSTYQQALDDFGITELMFHIRNYVDEDFKAALMNLEEQELEGLAAVLIQRLTSSLNGKLLTGYLNAIRHGNSQILFDPSNWEIPLSLMDLPDRFPDGIMPRYQEGDRIRWQTVTNMTDWGVVMGRCFAYARHRCQWGVCYLVKLDRNSPSAAWITADTAWEEDLEPNTDEDWEQLEQEESAGCDRPNETGESDCPKGRPEGHRTTNPHALLPLPSPSSSTPDLMTRTAPTPTPTKNGYLSSTFRNDFPTLHEPTGGYRPNGKNGSNPRILTQRERDLIELYSHCQLGLTPMKFYAKWSVRYEELASICSRSTSTVERWFNRGSNYRRPTFNDLRHLAIMDFLLEHFEEIPSPLLNLLCSPSRS